MALDIDFVRSQFPALASGWAFLDNAGGSQVLKSVADRVSDYLLTTSVQTGASYETSQRAGDRVAEARARMAMLVGARQPEEIVFGHSTTVLMRFLATAMASQFQPGDEIIVTDFDHESNIGPWLTLQERGVVFKFWPIDRDTLKPDLDTLERLMGPRTKLVCVTHASNILGTINPIRAISDFVHERGAKLCVDGVAFAPHRALDVVALGADFYVFSLYKTYGPHLGVLYGRSDLLLELDGLYHYFYGKEKISAKMEPGNPNYELAWGSGGISDYLEQLGRGEGRPAIERAFDDIAAHEAEIGEQFLAWLRGRNDVTILGERSSDATLRVPTISFTVQGKAPADIIAHVDPEKIGIRHGDFHSRRLIEALDLAPAGVIRVSMVHYNTAEEVSRVIAALDRAIAA
ncbi:cysteine desulfurase-like protein [Mesorhizobium sp. NBSH29]|uniref:cysteine desulfurase-like protein n=1 Tax=Mesorhizobium sp. NBSH29 TaxID=2654249 RepID=UPI00189651CF|nr:cysteine desulfurase-like protein [Mesorhizobium sp. NBSH29]QPC88348.1 cysteine desulfurase-like protein [Mesorhizobium sp. NBSH29]